MAQREIFRILLSSFLGALLGQGLNGQVSDPSGEDARETLILIGDDDLTEESMLGGSPDFLQAGRDVFLSAAAFDFSPVFFRVRGLDSRYSRVYLNGLPMNRFYDGRPQWNNWGGLNDASRNQRQLVGPSPPGEGFGGIQGTTVIDIGPGSAREGLRLTCSASDRNYQGRWMATYNTGIRDHGWGLLLSASRRHAAEAYAGGTPYDAFSFLASAAYQPSREHEFSLTGLLATNARGRSAALTREVLELKGRQYNPFWGLLQGEVRNSRMRRIREPLLNFRYRYRQPQFTATLSAAYQWGTQARTRLGYFDAPNPDPTYYRNLPSYYWNQSFGPNLLSAAASRAAFLESPQIGWEHLYAVNANRERASAAYILLSDRTDEELLSVNSFLSLGLGKHWRVQAGMLFQDSGMQQYALLEDLLGASLHRDVDPFSQTRNDLDGPLEKAEGDRIGYDYRLLARRREAFLTLQASLGRCSAYLSGKYGQTGYRREGLFRNERFAEEPDPGGTWRSFLSPGWILGGSFRITGRHWLQFNSVLEQRPPVVRDVYINPRERPEAVPGSRPENLFAADFSYFFRGPEVSLRITGYHNRVQGRAEVNYFYTDSGHGSGFVQEVSRGTDLLHRGVELGLEAALGPSVEMRVSLALGDHRFSSDPELSLFFLPGEDPGDIRGMEGRLDLGPARLKGLHVPSGPSRAASLGLRYRAPSFWWAGFTANYLDGNYPDLARIRHTRSFRLDPETGEPLTGVGEDEFQRALRQQALPPAYLLNLTAGKSWRWGPHYISLFASLSNVLDQFFLSGGYQQSRNGNYKQWYEDHLGGRPSFGTKYWPGAGRTYFINLSWSYL